MPEDRTMRDIAREAKGIHTALGSIAKSLKIIAENSKNKEVTVNQQFNDRRGEGSVRAMFVTEDNAQEVAEWCGGDVVEQKGLWSDEVVIQYINVPLAALNTYTQANAGMYVVEEAPGIFRAWSARRFDDTFEHIPNHDGTQRLGNRREAREI